MDYRYTAIVLKKREVGETDRLYTFYTREAGKIQALAKGVRKPEAKLASSLETLSEADIMIVRTRGMGKIAGAILEKSFPHLRREYAALAPVVEALKNFEQLVDLEERDEKLYALLSTFLQTVEQLAKSGKSEKAPLLSEAFLYQLLFYLGYQLELSRCAITGEKLQSGERFALSPSVGGVVSQDGVKEVPDGFPLTENAIKILRLFSSQSLEKLGKISLDEKDLVQIQRFRKLFFQWVKR